MKEATGEVSMTVITIVLVAVVLGIAYGLFGNEDSVGRVWLNNIFGDMTEAGDDAMGNATNGGGTGAVDAGEIGG